MTPPRQPVNAVLVRLSRMVGGTPGEGVAVAPFIPRGAPERQYRFEVTLPIMSSARFATPDSAYLAERPPCIPELSFGES
jgi:hypothetical protein